MLSQNRKCEEDETFKKGYLAFSLSCKWRVTFCRRQSSRHQSAKPPYGILQSGGTAQHNDSSTYAIEGGVISRVKEVAI